MADALAPARIFNPRDALHMRGMMREPVGGGIIRGPVNSEGIPILNRDGSVPVVRVRGLTYSLNVTNVSQEMYPVDTDRKMIYLLNNDAVGVVWVYFGGNGGPIGQGMRLGPAGGGILLDNHVPTSRIFMIGTIAANPNVTAVIA